MEITKSELEKYRGSKVGDVLVRLSIAQGFMYGEDHISVSFRANSVTSITDVVSYLDFIKSVFELQKGEPCEIIGNVMADTEDSQGKYPYLDNIGIEYWDTLNSVLL